MLDHRHAVRAVRHHCAGREIDRLAVVDMFFGSLADQHFSNNAEKGGRAFPRPVRVLGLYRVPVHERTRERRYIFRCGDLRR
jgi:hypothetical protein